MRLPATTPRSPALTSHSGNRFQDVLLDEGLVGADKVFASVKDLALEENLLTWEEICHVATKFPVLSTLSVDLNQLTSLPPVPLLALATTLTSLNLEFNDFTSFTDIATLSELRSLRNLHLKGNNISSITTNVSGPRPVFPPSLQFLDVSYNQVSTWEFIEDLPSVFPGLLSLRFAHNPIYENPDPEHSAQSKTVAEEAYMIALGRLPNIKVLNFGNITRDDRQNAEMFYLARIGKHLAAVPPNQESEVIKKHRRYAELCELYGPPVVKRTKDMNPAFLEARLVAVQFVHRARDSDETVEKSTKIPKSFDIYRVKGIAGKLFEQKPLDLRLVWETGEWDPVAGFDDEVDDSGEEEPEPEPEAPLLPETAQAGSGAQEDKEPALQTERKVGKWVKREVELQDGPRQLGFCVDGQEARIRVEIR